MNSQFPNIYITQVTRPLATIRAQQKEPVIQLPKNDQSLENASHPTHKEPAQELVYTTVLTQQLFMDYKNGANTCLKNSAGWFWQKAKEECPIN